MMERLTRLKMRNNPGRYRECGHYTTNHSLGVVVNRLAEYEDTGLTPEEVGALADEVIALRARLERAEGERDVAVKALAETKLCCHCEYGPNTDQCSFPGGMAACCGKSYSGGWKWRWDDKAVRP